MLSCADDGDPEFHLKAMQAPYSADFRLALFSRANRRSPEKPIVQEIFGSAGLSVSQDSKTGVFPPVPSTDIRNDCAFRTAFSSVALLYRSLGRRSETLRTCSWMTVRQDTTSPKYDLLRVGGVRCQLLGFGAAAIALGP